MGEQSLPENNQFIIRDGKTVEIASPQQRFATFLLDTLFIYILSFVLGFILAIGLTLIGKTVPEIKKDNIIIGLFIPLLYYSIQESVAGQTLGKLIMGTKVLKEDGTKLSVKRAILRTLCRYIPLEIFSFLGGEGPLRGWHDKIPKTIVISLKRTREKT